MPLFFIPITFKFLVAKLPIMILDAIIGYALSLDKETRKTFFVYFIHTLAPANTYLFYALLNRFFKRFGILIRDKKPSSARLTSVNPR